MKSSLKTEINSWPFIKSEVQKQWPKIKIHELDRTKGDLKRIEKLIAHYYGDKNHQFKFFFNEILKEFEACDGFTYTE